MGKSIFVIALAVLVLLGWGVVFFNGVCLNSLPFRQMVNLVSVKVPAPVPPVPSVITTPEGPPDPESGVLKNSNFAIQPIPEIPANKQEPDSVNIARIKLFLQVIGVTSDLGVLVWSWIFGFMGYPYTNLLLLTWLSATLGSLVNYTVVALRRSNNPGQGTRGGGRMLHSVTGSLVVGVGLGFTMYVAIVGGATVITKSGLSITSPDDYANKAAIISLLTLLAALFPGWFLNVLEVRLQQANSSNGGSGSSSAAKPLPPYAVTVEVQPKDAGTANPALIDSLKVVIRGDPEYVRAGDGGKPS
ncbi:MAG: hypothetical protein JSR77_10840 [Planctomycetes bacterium]|nr:hypothetical protein [Planctomycetota bacterium]